jgi:lipopolysaccharide exporter
MNMLHNINQIFNSQNLLGRSVRAGSILTLGSFVENILRFIRNVILARLLAPEAFGLMATVLASVAVIETFSEVGLKQSVIQNKNGAAEGFLNIIWWISSMRALVLYIIGYFIAPLICDFYDKPELLLIIRVAFLAILFNGFLSPRIHVLEKEMSFKNWIFLMQGSGVLGILVAISLAFYLQNVWALVIGYVTESCLRCILSFLFFPVIPQFSLNQAFLQDILTFSKRMFGLPILMMLFLQADVFVIGKVLSLSQLGIYALARSLAEMPNTFLSRIIHPIVLPTLSLIQDDKDKIKATILNLTRWTAVFGLPFIAFLIIFSEPILSIVYGAQYAIAAAPFGLLCVSNLILICSSFIMNMYIATGQPHIHRIASFTRTTLFLIIIYPATLYVGLVGAAFSVLIAMCLLLTIQVVYLKRLLDIRFLEYLNVWMEGITLCLVVVIPGVLLKIVAAGSHFIFSILLGIFLCLISWGLGINKVVQLHKKNVLFASNLKTRE